MGTEPQDFDAIGDAFRNLKAARDTIKRKRLVYTDAHTDDAAAPLAACRRSMRAWVSGRRG
jgi:hypothetical protein